MQDKMTFVLTSCGRTFLLNRVLETFFKFNKFNFENMYIVEDSLDLNTYKKIKEKWGSRIKIICNKQKKGQIRSIIDVYRKIKTPYIFHCEDDWLYTRSNFIEDSLKILKTDPKIIQVWLESRKSASRLDIFSYGKLETKNGVKFRKVSCKEGWEWGHFSFRPGVKRLSDYKLINGYEKFQNELDISVEYKKLGFYTVIIDKPAVEDIGDDHHVSDPTRIWPKRRKKNSSTGLKRLWGHIKRLKF